MDLLPNEAQNAVYAADGRAKRLADLCRDLANSTIHDETGDYVEIAREALAHAQGLTRHLAEAMPLLLAADSARCRWECPHGDRCVLSDYHDGGHNHRECDCNERSARRQALDCVSAERDRQDVQWGGPVHDDEHHPSEWLDYIARQLTMASHAASYDDYRDRLVKIAALAVAAFESSERREARGDEAFARAMLGATGVPDTGRGDA